MTQKINNSKLKTLVMEIVFFQVNDKDKKPQRFKKTLLLTKISIDVVLEIFFLILNNVKVKLTH